MIVSAFSAVKDSNKYFRINKKFVKTDYEIREYEFDHLADSVFLDLIKYEDFKSFVSKATGKFFKGESLNGPERMVCYYIFKHLKDADFTSFYKDLESKGKQLDNVLNELEDAISKILGEDIEYGLRIGEELYNSMPKNNFPSDLINENGEVSEKYRKPRYDNFIGDDYYKTGRNGELYYPYAFRHGPNNPDVNHNMSQYNPVVDKGFDAFKSFMEDVFSLIDSLSKDEIVNIVKQSYKNGTKSFKSGAVDYIVDIFTKMKQENKFVVDNFVFSSFENMPTLIYSKYRNDSFGIFAVNLGFISDKVGVRPDSVFASIISSGSKQKSSSGTVGTKKRGRPSKSASTQATGAQSSGLSEYNLTSDDLIDFQADASFVWSDETYEYQHKFFKDILSNSEFNVIYDIISEFAYSKISGHAKYSTFHNLLTATLFSILVTQASPVYGKSGYVVGNISLVDTLELDKDNLENYSIKKIDLKVSEDIKYSGEMKKLIVINQNSPAMPVFLDSEGIQTELRGAVLGATTLRGQSFTDINDLVHIIPDIIG